MWDVESEANSQLFFFKITTWLKKTNKKKQRCKHKLTTVNLVSQSKMKDALKHPTVDS